MTPHDDQAAALHRLGVRVRTNDVNWYYLSAISVILLAIAMLCYIFYLMFFPFQVIALNAVPMAVTSKVIQAGEPLHYVIDYCKTVSTPSTVSRELLSADHDYLIALPVSTSTLPPGCHKMAIAEDIPAYVPAGIYRMRTTRTYRLNAYRDIPIVFETEAFEVTAPQTVPVPRR